MKKDTLQVQIIQSSLVWEDAEANFESFEKHLVELGPGDLVLLPEMFPTGFTMNPERLADGQGRVLVWMKEMANRFQKALCGSVAVREAGQHFNRLYFVQPDGVSYKYDKRHLFTMGDEPNHYSAGKDRIVIEYLGWKILPLVCYDLRFPVYSRNDIGYDMLLYVANWPAKRAHHWKSLLMARAIENQSYLAACNRVGDDGNAVAHSGDSCLINYKGDILASLSEEEGYLSAEFSYDELVEARTKFPVLPDADSFSAEWK